MRRSVSWQKPTMSLQRPGPKRVSRLRSTHRFWIWRKTIPKFGINSFSAFGLRTNSRYGPTVVSLSWIAGMTSYALTTTTSDALQSKRMESVMKLNSAQVEQTLTQFEAQVIPDDHPLVPKLNELFCDHTFFLDTNGLNVVEANESIDAGAPAGTVVNLANWSDAQLTSLAPHEPEPTEVVVILESKH